MACSKRSINFLGKHTLFKGIRKYFFQVFGVIPVNRLIKDESVIPHAEKVLINKGALGIFPEGTINRTDDIIMPFKMGAVKMAQATNALIVPFIINGRYKIFGSDLKIIFLEPIEIKNKDLEEENKQLMNLIANKLKEVKEK